MNYSIENAKKFNWSSINGNLNPERISHLKQYLVGSEILDAGCGGGAYVNYLSEQGLTVTGVDLHKEFLDIAYKKCFKGIYVQANLYQLPFADKSFDCSYCFDVLEHIDDQAAIIELARVTRKRLIIAVPQEEDLLNQYGLTFKTYLDPTHLRYYNQKSLQKLCAIVNPSKITIIDEGLIHTREIVEKLIHSVDLLKLRQLNNFRIPQFILDDKKIVSIYNFSLNKLLNKASFRKINLGLLSVIDLS